VDVDDDEHGIAFVVDNGEEDDEMTNEKVCAAAMRLMPNSISEKRYRDAAAKRSVPGMTKKEINSYDFAFKL
jgi:hypothetical protein